MAKQGNIIDRWMAVIQYSNGVQRTFTFDALGDLTKLAEMEPDWHTIERMVITHAEHEEPIA